METTVADMARIFLPRSGLADLVRLLIEHGYDVIAPTLKDGVLSMRSISSADELPRAHGTSKARAAIAWKTAATSWLSTMLLGRTASSGFCFRRIIV